MSQRLFYDKGGAGPALSASSGTASTRLLEIDASGEWRFGNSRGKWSVQPISKSDWESWKSKPYGPKRKIILRDWQSKGRTAEGPVEESNAIDFLWVFYRVESPTVQNPGTVQMKFGRANSKK